MSVYDQTVNAGGRYDLGEARKSDRGVRWHKEWLGGEEGNCNVSVF